MELIARGTPYDIDIKWNGEQWWLRRLEGTTWELYHLNDVQPTRTITNNNKGRVFALALFYIINQGGAIPA